MTANAFGDKGVKLLADALAKLVNLTFLNLDRLVLTHRIMTFLNHQPKAT